MKLEEGMYVRTKKGIGKVVEVKKHDSWGFIIKIIGQYNCYTHTSTGNLSDILKASFNIIDLIEVGDYVNGYKILEVDYDVEEEKYIRIDKAQDGLKTILRSNDIKSLVTHEQFEQISYNLPNSK